jgi:hypothetical protein
MNQEPLLTECLTAYGIRKGGVLHIGAGFLEEAGIYKELGLDPVIWVEGNPEEREKRQQVADEHGQTLIIGAVSSKCRDNVEFHVASNSYSSSLHPFGTHTKFYPDVVEDRVILLRTITGRMLLKQHPEAAKCNILVIDVQGEEERVVVGFKGDISQFDCIHSEVYYDGVYQGAGQIWAMDAHLYALGFLRVETWIKKGEGWGDAFWVKRSLL